MAAGKIPSQNLSDEQKAEYNKLQGEFDGKALGALKTQKEYNEELARMKRLAAEASEKFDDILKSLKNQTARLQLNNKEYNFALKSVRDIKSITTSLLSDKKGENLLTQKQLSINRTTLDIERQRLNNLKAQGKITNLQAFNAIAELEQSMKYNDARLKQEKQINTTIGGSTNLLQSLNGQLDKYGVNLGVQKEGMDLVQARMRTSAEAGASGMTTLLKGGKEYLSQLGQQVDSMDTIQKGWTKVYDQFKKLDTVSVDFARTTSMTREQAWATLQTLNQYTRTQEKLTDTSQDFLESNTKINQQLGIGVVLTKQQLSQYTELSKLGKFDEETMQSLVVSSALNNTNIEESTKERFRGFAVVQRTYGVQLNERALLREMAKLSATTRLNYMGQEQALAKAAAQAKMMGTDLAKMDGVANSLMDFEGSIQKQMEAEVLTGQTLNLERARYFALTNDINGVMTELNAQGITADKFSKMNRIQQSAIAESMGMQKDEMASMLVEQKSIMAMGADSYKKKKEQYLLDVKALGIAEANKKVGNDALATQLEQVTNAELQDIAQRKMGDSMQELVMAVKPISDFFTKMNVALAKAVSFVESIGKGFAYISGMKAVEWLMGGAAKIDLKSVAAETAEIAKAKELVNQGVDAGGKGLTKDLLGKAGLAGTTNGATGAAAASALKSSGSTSTISGIGEGAASGGLKGFFGNMMSNIKGGATGFVKTIATNPVEALKVGFKQMGAGGFVKKLMSGIGVGTLIEAFFANMDIKDIIASHAGQDKSSLAQPVGQRVAEGIGSVGGGALLGALLSPIPGGTFVGGMLGAYGGKLLGGWLGEEATDLGNSVLDLMYKKEMKSADIKGLATGGVVTQGGLAKVDTGEVYLGANSLQVLKDLVTETRKQNDYLQALVRKDTSVSIDGQHLAGAVARNVITSYGNLLNPSSTTYR